MNEETFQDLLKEISCKERTLSYVSDQLTQLKAMRSDACPHTETEEGYYYFSGSYYDTDYEDFWTVCKCCGTKSEVTRKQGNCYG